MKTLIRAILCIISGLSLTWTVLIIGTVIAWLTAPAFLGIVLLAGSTLLIVKACAGIAFVVGVMLSWFTGSKINTSETRKS